jgi:hypothetical protein
MTESKLGTVDEVMNVVLPSGVRSISGDAFAGYAALRSLTIQPGCVEIEDGTVGEVMFGVAKQRTGAMARCVSLVKVTIPETCTMIGKYAFRDCSAMTRMTVPSGVTSIGDEAFFSCWGLAQLTIASSVTRIGNSAFSGCSALTRLTIPSTVAGIGGFAFLGCAGLSELTIASGLTSIEPWVFGGCRGITRVTIPSSVTSIGGYAFVGCPVLTELTIPASITEIGKPDHEVFNRKTLECVTLVGCPLNQAIVEAVERALAPGAKVISPVLAGQMFGRFAIVAAS